MEVRRKFTIMQVPLPNPSSKYSKILILPKEVKQNIHGMYIFPSEMQRKKNPMDRGQAELHNWELSVRPFGCGSHNSWRHLVSRDKEEISLCTRQTGHSLGFVSFLDLLNQTTDRWQDGQYLTFSLFCSLAFLLAAVGAMHIHQTLKMDSGIPF